MTGHSIAAVGELKSSLLATTGGKGPEIRPKRFSQAFYVLGFVSVSENLITAEMREYMPCAVLSCEDFYWDRVASATVVLFLIFAICLIGAQAFARVSSVIFVVVLVSVVWGLGGIVYYSIIGPELSGVDGFVGLSWSRLREALGC